MCSPVAITGILGASYDLGLRLLYDVLVCAGYGLAVENLHATLSGECIVSFFWSYASHLSAVIQQRELTQRWQSAKAMRVMQILVCDVRPGFIMFSASFDSIEVCHAFKIMEVKVELTIMNVQCGSPIPLTLPSAKTEQGSPYTPLQKDSSLIGATLPFHPYFGMIRKERLTKVDPHFWKPMYFAAHVMSHNALGGTP